MDIRSERGNALFYVLLGVVLFAALSFIITRQMGNDGLTAQLSADKADIIAAQIIDFSTAVKFSVQQMVDNGSQVTDIDFVLPGEAGYDTPPHMHKVFHPGGGGITPMNVRPEYGPTTAVPMGWRFQKGQNVDWTPTTQSDLLLSFIELSQPICAAINKRITGSTTIPAHTVDLSNTFIFGATDDGFTAAECPSCNGKVSFCFYNNTRYVFYSVLHGR